MPEQIYNAFVGTSSGVLKGIRAVEKCNLVIKNLDNLKCATNKNPITAMNWADGAEEEILLGYGSQLVKVYDLNSRSFTMSEEKKIGDGPIVGIAKSRGVLMTAVESGVVKLWNDDGDPTLIETGGHLERMRHNKQHNGTIATGGKENDLKLWDIETGKQTFTAKNVRHDNLEMRVPIWVTDIAFINNTNKVAVTTRHGHVRLYDPSTCMRRPVVSVQIPEQALTCISCSSKDHHVIVGSGTGQMNLVDLRSKGLVMNKYKGFVGGVKAIACSAEEPYIASVSLDRHFRIHHLSTKELLFKIEQAFVAKPLGGITPRMAQAQKDTSTNGVKLIVAWVLEWQACLKTSTWTHMLDLIALETKQEYMQSKLTCLLLRSDFDLTQKDNEVETGDEDEMNTKKAGAGGNSSSSEEYDELFQNMPTVGEKRPRSAANNAKKKHKS